MKQATKTFTLHGDKVLLSVGRRPVTKGFGLETLAPETFRNGVKVNEYMQTSLPNVYACGDITAFSLLAHTAVSEAEVALPYSMLSTNCFAAATHSLSGVGLLCSAFLRFLSFTHCSTYRHG